jgi:hypothetical protein
MGFVSFKEAIQAAADTGTGSYEGVGIHKSQHK